MSGDVWRVMGSDTRGPAASLQPPAQAMPEPQPPSTTWQEQEMVAIRSAVSSAGGNISRAARQLGVARNTIYRKLRAADATG